MLGGRGQRSAQTPRPDGRGDCEETKDGLSSDLQR